MTENRRFYYLKLKENFYNSETMVILESMQDGLLYSNLLLKMYLMSLKSSGVLLLNDCLPHTVQTIATFTRHQVGTVERALKIFQEFGPECISIFCRNSRTPNGTPLSLGTVH